MITLRCTQKLKKFLGVSFADNLSPTTSFLGDWYANLIPTAAGELILFVNEKTLLTVGVPVWESVNLLPLFSARVANILILIGIHPIAIEKEMLHYYQLQFGKTASRSILGSMNDFTKIIQFMTQNATTKEDLGLSNIELDLSQTPCKPIDYKAPIDVARELLNPLGNYDN
ncbi:MAG: hypothetical protein PVF83_07330 [Anaerolineales bacterium]|jgi:hypothetical protein